MIKKIWVTMILIGTKFPSPLEMTNLLLHTHESWIEPLTTCLREPNSLPLGPIHCWLKFIYLMVKKYVHGNNRRRLLTESLLVMPAGLFVRTS
jgi:hypothetical protein